MVNLHLKLASFSNGSDADRLDIRAVFTWKCELQAICVISHTVYASSWVELIDKLASHCCGDRVNW